MKRNYRLNEFDVLILESILRREFATIREIHEDLSGYTFIQVMRAVHNLTQNSFLFQQVMLNEAVYSLKNKVEKMQRALAS